MNTAGNGSVGSETRDSEMRAANETERIARSNEAFRVFYDLDKEGTNE